jgi:hypothetical protein
MQATPFGSFGPFQAAIAGKLGFWSPFSPVTLSWAERRLSRIWAPCVIGSQSMDICPARPAPNQRLKLSARGGRLMGNESVLSAAAAGRSLSAIR